MKSGELTRWILRGSFLLLLALVADFVIYRMRGPTPAQHAALELMQKDRHPKKGVNAFPLLWSMHYDVAADRLDEQLAADIEHLRLLQAADSDTAAYEPSVTKLPEPRPDDAGLCHLRKPNCLARVMADPASARNALEKYEAIARKTRMLEATDFLWDELPANPGTPEPIRGSTQDLWLSSLALQFVSGDHAAAIAGTCRNILTWRRLRHGTNTLIGDMLSIAFADDALHLLADMLVLQPLEAGVPPECVHALQPIEAADVDRCTGVAGTFAQTLGAYTLIAPKKGSLSGPAIIWLVFDRAKTTAVLAERMSGHCEKRFTEALLHDIEPEAIEPFIKHAPECLANIAGCELLAIPMLPYAQYDQRALDFAAHLRLAATLLWLRENSEGSLSERFERRPAHLRSATHASSFDESQGKLYVDNFYAAREKRFELTVGSGDRSESKDSVDSK